MTFKKVEFNPEKPIAQVNCDKHGEYGSQHIIGRIWSPCPQCMADSFAAEEKRIADELRIERIAAWERRIGQAGIPDRFRDRTLQSYQAATDEQQKTLSTCAKYAHHFDEVLKRGASLILCGKPGTGKTHLAVGIGLHAMHHFHSTVMFTTAMRMMRMVTDTYDRGSEKTVTRVVGELVFPDLLIIDEVGVQVGSDNEKRIFFDVLNERYEKRKPTIFLSNLDIAGVKSFLGERVYDRLKEDGCKYLSLDWASYRGKK